MEKIKISVPNWLKYNPRTDRKTSSWFRFESDFFNSQALYELTDSERLLFIFILCECSKKQTSDIELLLCYMADRRKTQQSRISKDLQSLTRLGVIAVSNGSDLVSSGLATNERTNDTNERNVRIGQKDLTDTDFSFFWTAYPRKVKKSDALKKYVAEIKAGALAADILSAVDKYRGFCIAEKKEAQYVMHPSSFLNGWRDWLEADAGVSTDFSESDEKYKRLFAKENGDL